MSICRPRPIGAFTLVELTICIAIIAVVSLITFGVVMRAKDGAKDTEILANMRQIGTSHILYAQDYDDGLPCSVPVNGGKPVLDKPGEPFDPKKPGSLKKYTEDPGGWKLLLLGYGSSTQMFYSSADPFARSDRTLWGTIGPANSKETSVTYPGGAVTPIDIVDGKVYWTMSKAEDRSRSTGAPLLITNIYKPEGSNLAATVHRLGRRVPVWFWEGNARFVDLKEASPIHD
jgi:prepilin-type N-terminal cleavage/methylation domain-containing protein